MLQDVISLLGIANPQLSFAWQDVNAPAADASVPFLLNSNAAGGEWMAPVAGLFNQAFAPNIFMGDGSAAAGTAWVLKMQPQVYTRLLRLYGRVIEGKTTQTDQPQRPVPMYFVFHDTTDSGTGPVAGNYEPGSKLSIKNGKLSVHDFAGQPIDPLAVASAFVVIAAQFPAIVAKDFTSSTSPVLANTQLSQLTASLTAEVRVRLVSLFRKPMTQGTQKFNNLAGVKDTEGLYKVSNTSQPLSPVNPPAGADEKWEIGPATFGLMSGSFTPQATAQSVTLKRDFLTLFADDLTAHIRGSETLGNPFDVDDFKTSVFHGQSLEFFLNGSQVLAKEEQVIRDSALSLAVSPVIANDFAVAADPANAEWPVFPAGGDGPISGRLENVTLSAHFLTAPADKRDAYLQMEVPQKDGTPQLAEGTAVRVYNRKFLADAREGRGNGAGGVLNASFTAGFIIKNPFGLRKDEQLPVKPQLLFDLVAVNRTGKKRSFGFLGTEVSAPAALTPAETTLAGRGTNQFTAATEQSIAPAGLLGLPTAPLSSIGGITDINSAVDVALGLGNEGQPRIPPRLPLMKRNDNAVAGINAAGAWSAVLSGMWLRGDSRSSLHRVGSPGSPGGEEFLGFGAATSGGILAYQAARAALRRTRGLAARLQELNDDQRWAVPANPPATGNFSVALLQDIAPGADSANIKLMADSVFDSLPQNWSALVNSIANVLPSSIAANTAVKNAVTALAGSTAGDLLYKEFRHETFTARFGRRDSMPAVRSAIAAAKELIYIETSAFSFTDYKPNNPADTDNANDPPNKETDIVSLIAKQLEEKPGLRVLIAVNKEFPVGPGYESFAARAYDRRIKAFNALKSAGPGRVQLFHPIGFPGRPVRLMHTVVIVDDMWLFAGSGSFTRRGFMFDGNLSLICFNRDIEAGRSKEIRRVRRKLMENHLGTTPLPGGPAAAVAHPNVARLAGLQEAYFAVADMLEQGGSGLIEGLFDGKVTGQDPIPASSYPHRDLADPDGLSFPSTLGSLLQVFTGLGEADA